MYQNIAKNELFIQERDKYVRVILKLVKKYDEYLIIHSFNNRDEILIKSENFHVAKKIFAEIVSNDTKEVIMKYTKKI